MDIAGRKALIDRFLAAYNAFDEDGMLALVSADVRIRNFLGDRIGGSAHGREECRRLLERTRGLFAEREQRVTAWVTDAEQTIAHFVHRGTLAADMPDGPPAGSVLNLRGASEYSFAGGRICRIVDRY